MPGDDYKIAATWELRRGNDTRVLHIDFDGLDDMRTLPIEQSYACRIRGSNTSLLFRKNRNIWDAELTSFVASLEPTEIAPP